MILIDVMLSILFDNGAMSTKHMASYIKQNKFYCQGEELSDLEQQIDNIVRDEKNLFKQEGEIIRLYDNDMNLKSESQALYVELFDEISCFENDPQNDWFHESKISGKLAEYLIQHNYILSQNNSEKIESRGIDIIAERDGKKELIEVKGYPSIYYKDAKKRREGMVKKTKPGLQCTHWFDDCLSTTIKNYGSKDDIIAMAFPACARYEKQMYMRQAYFTDNNLNIKIYFVKEDGSVVIDNMNRKLGINRE